MLSVLLGNAALTSCGSRYSISKDSVIVQLGLISELSREVMTRVEHDNPCFYSQLDDMTEW